MPPSIGLGCMRASFECFISAIATEFLTSSIACWKAGTIWSADLRHGQRDRRPRVRAHLAGPAPGLAVLAGRRPVHPLARGEALLELLREPGQRRGPVRRPSQWLGLPEVDGAPAPAPGWRPLVTESKNSSGVDIPPRWDAVFQPQPCSFAVTQRKGSGSNSINRERKVPPAHDTLFRESPFPWWSLP